MYTEFIIIYAALAVIVLLLAALLVLVIRLTKRDTAEVYFPTGNTVPPVKAVPTQEAPAQAQPCVDKIVFCTSCGAAMNPEQKFCPRCGSKR